MALQCPRCELRFDIPPMLADHLVTDHDVPPEQTDHLQPPSARIGRPASRGDRPRRAPDGAGDER
ncbi:MAG TPA: hypothetical protein VMM13_11590 [Euzebya sp.]|nr:hypothetical protein [Euzebya sp.]